MQIFGSVNVLHLFHQLVEDKGHALIYIPDQPERDTDVYITVELALRTAIELKEKGRRVLMVADNIKDTFVSLFSISDNLGLKTVHILNKPSPLLGFIINSLITLAATHWVLH